MAKRLTSKLGIAVLAGAGALASWGLSGCATFPEGHVYGAKYADMKQSRVSYNLEEQVIYEKRYYLQKSEKTDDSLPFEFMPFEKTTREIDLDSKKISLSSKEIYIPKLVEVSEYTKDKYADEIELTTKGSFSIKADISSVEMPDGLGNEFGYKIIVSEEGASFAIRTIKILGIEYFFPHVADKKTADKGKLPFYLIPVKGAKIKIQNICGNVTIRNENKIYRPELFVEKLVEKKTESFPTPGREIFLSSSPLK